MHRININVGILGHVDSGKTSLAKCLSQIQSTAAFDKNPQSQQRGITLDLGFSSFTIPTPAHLSSHGNFNELQFTLVDCPGHASLIRTIIGGAQIIDVMLLVIDVTKGIQMQTAECLVIGGITCPKMIIALNKIDLKEESGREKEILKMKQKVQKTLIHNGYSDDLPMIPVSALTSNGVPDLIEALANLSEIPQRCKEGPFHFAVDHCFAIKGQGTVMTGTILQGCVKLNDTIEIPKLGERRKVKSMQMFKETVQEAVQGDRLGICVTQLDPKLFERGIACSPDLGTFVSYAIAEFNLIKHFKAAIESKSKYHITIGHETIVANITLFCHADNECFHGFQLNNEYEFVERFDNDSTDESGQRVPNFVLLHFQTPVYGIKNCLTIASKLDMEIQRNTCRLAFWGKLVAFVKEDELNQMKIFKYKQRTGSVDRVIDKFNVIVKNLFKKETRIEPFLHLKVELVSGDLGVIEHSFGQTGKVKVYIASGISCENEEDLQMLKNSEVLLKFKKYIFNNATHLKQ